VELSQSVKRVGRPGRVTMIFARSIKSYALMPTLILKESLLREEYVNEKNSDWQ
jgi:hypothetical protein